MSMSNTMICAATKIWYYVLKKSSGAFEAWLNATQPGYIENLEAVNKVALQQEQHLICSECLPFDPPSFLWALTV